MGRCKSDDCTSTVHNTVVQVQIQLYTDKQYNVTKKGNRPFLLQTYKHQYTKPQQTPSTLSDLNLWSFSKVIY